MTAAGDVPAPARARLAGALERIKAAGLSNGEAVDVVLAALDGHLVDDGELVAFSDEAIADARARLSASVRKVLDDEVRR